MSGNSDSVLEAKLEKLNISQASDEKPAQVKKRTGLVYDERMKKHANIWDKDHMEVPDRVGRPYNKHIEYGLLERCYRIPSRFATEDELSTFHSKKHIDKMKGTQGMKTRDLFNLGEEYDSIYMSEVSGQLTAGKKDEKTIGLLTQLGDKYESDYLSEHVYECALLACGCTLEAVEHVATNKVQNAVAIVRPPGHHADTDSAMGYCFFNNVAIAAKIAQQKWGMKKVLIVDWDIHHGNGTQNLFESDPSVLYFSTHVYQHAKFYPFSTIANYDVVGEGPGKGFNINVPWNKFHMGDADYLAAFQHVLLPIAYEFDPDIVLVSAGFDSARGDPKGHCDITPEGYCHLTNMLMSLAGGKVVIILEGGYNLTSVEESMCSCTSTLLGDPCPRLEGSSLVPSRSAMESIKNVVNTHKPFWKCLEFVDFSIPDAEKKEEKKEITTNGDNVVTEDLISATPE